MAVGGCLLVDWPLQVQFPGEETEETCLQWWDQTENTSNHRLYLSGSWRERLNKLDEALNVVLCVLEAANKVNHDAGFHSFILGLSCREHLIDAGLCVSPGGSRRAELIVKSGVKTVHTLN